jgi:hypothetical protein
MSRLTILADDHAELISGGWSSTRINRSSFTKVSTRLGQTNNVTNLGIGLLGGGGNAQSIQGNSAEILTFAG